MPRNADEALNAPPIIAVVTTERVSRYTQNVTANQRNVLVTPLSSEVIRSLRKAGTGASQTVRWAGRSRVGRAASGRSAAAQVNRLGRDAVEPFLPTVSLLL